MPGSIFLSYAKEDIEAVRRIHVRLRRDGFDAWLDEHDLLPGQDWEAVIRNAIQRSRVFVVFLSESATTKTGYIQKEILTALDAASMRPEGEIFIIPARLADCPVPDRLKRWQWIDVYQHRGYSHLRDALRHHVGTISRDKIDSRAAALIRFEAPIDHLLYQLCQDQGRFYHARVPKHGYAFSQGHFVVFRQKFPAAFKQLKDEIADYRSMPVANFTAMVPKEAKWRRADALVTKMGTPLGSDNSLVLVSATAATLLDPRYWRVALLSTNAPAFYVTGEHDPVYVEEDGRVTTVIMPRRMSSDDRRKIGQWRRRRG